MPNTLTRGTRPPTTPPTPPEKAVEVNQTEAEMAAPPSPTTISPTAPSPANLVPVQTAPAKAAFPDTAATAQNIPSSVVKRALATPAPSLHEDNTSMHHAATSAQPPVKPTMRADAVPTVMPDGERPKVWLATHKAPADPDPRLILLREPDSVRAACFRVMRHRLAERGNPRVIAVSSAGQGDGKTTCAANLALALSEFGRAKVLLLEANMRSPQLAVMFGFLPPECFSVQLQRHRERPLDPWSIVEAFSPSLHVLAVKPGEANRPLLDAPAFAIALEMLLRIGYDYIVVDTPPVLGSADVNLVEDYVDAIVLATRASTTRGRSLRAAVEQISPRKLVGVTLLDA